MNLGVNTLATTGELRAIIEELELVDIGDAASYLGEEMTVDEALYLLGQTASNIAVENIVPCDCIVCQSSQPMKDL